MFEIKREEAMRKLNKIEFLKMMQDLASKGIYVKSFDEQMHVLEIKLNNMQKLFYENYGIINIRSNNQVYEYLMNLKDYDVNTICYTKGKWKCGKEEIEQLCNLGYQFGEDLAEFRKLDEERKAYQKIENNVNIYNGKRVVYPEVRLGVTNRVQYKNPPIMGLPKKLITEILDTPNEKQSLWMVDIKNQEPNILANILKSDILKERLGGQFYERMYEWVFCAEPRLSVLSIDADRNYYKEVTEEEIKGLTSDDSFWSPVKTPRGMYYNGNEIQAIYPKIISVKAGLSFNKESLPSTVKAYCENVGFTEVPVEWNCGHSSKNAGINIIYGALKDCEMNLGNLRKTFKTNWNALTYGMSKMSLKKSLKGLDADIMYEKFNSIKELSEYRKQCKELAKNEYGNCYSYFGTQMVISGGGRNYRSRQYMDFPVQGTGADILELLFRHFYDCQPQGMEVYYTVHDALYILIDNGKTDEENTDILKELFIHKIDDWKPFQLDIEKVM